MQEKIKDDTISRQAVIAEFSCCELMPDGGIDANYAIDFLKQMPSVQPEGWLEQNKDKILQAGMEGREVEFRIGGRLFAIREKQVM